MRILPPRLAVPYGEPDAYSITVSGTREDRMICGYREIATKDALCETVHGFILVINHMTKKLREAGAEPRWWDCGYVYMDIDPTYDEYGDYIW